MTKNVTAVSSESVQLGSASPWKKYTASPSPAMGQGYPYAAPTQQVPGVASPMRPPMPTPQFTNIPTAPVGTFQAPMGSYPAPTMTAMPSFVPPGFPTQIPTQAPYGAAMQVPYGTPPQAPYGAPGQTTYAAPAQMPYGAAAQMPGPKPPAPGWNAFPASAAPTQLSGTVPGVAAAPVAGVSPGGYPPPPMPSFPVPGGTGGPGWPAPAQGAAPQTAPFQGALPQGVPLQGMPTQGFPQQGPQSFGPDPQRLVQALTQHPAFQGTLSTWAGNWLGSKEFKSRLADVLTAPDLQETLRKGIEEVMKDSSFIEEVARRAGGQKSSWFKN